MQDSASPSPNTDETYRMQLQQSIASLAQQMMIEPTPQGKASLQGKIDKLTQQLSSVPKQISLTRIMNLQQIFKHYCTHIFRVGKHMTFDRLQYQKTHMAMDRFFKFLQDFSLTTFLYEGKQRQLIPKSKLISIFKRVSSTSKDLNFEEFIECLEKIGVVFYDEKERYAERIKEEELRKKRIKDKIQRKKKKAGKEPLGADGKELKDSKDNKEENKGNQEMKDIEGMDSGEDKEEGAENDDLVKDMMKNPDDIENPNDQIDKVIKDKQQQLQSKIKSKQQKDQKLGDQSGSQDLIQQQKPQHLNSMNSMSTLPHQNTPIIQDDSIISKPLPSKISTQQKVQLFYKMIGVDNIRDYRNKLSELGHPLFKQYENKTDLAPATETQRNMEDEESMRLQMIKEKINEKKAMVKNQTPKKATPAEENEFYKMQEERRLKKEKEKERLERAKRLKEDEFNKKVEMQDQLQKNQKEKKKVEPKDPNKPPPVFKENSVTFDGIEKLNFEQLNMKSFHPHSLYNLQPEDEEYMGDLKFDAKNLERYKQMNRVRERKDDKLRGSVSKGEVQKIAEIKEKKTQAVVQNTKRRASEIEKSEKTKEKHMDDKTRRLSEAKTPRTKLKA